MNVGSAGLDIIKQSEALRLTAYAATEDERARGIWTIGYGHTRGVKEGDTCTVAEAEAFLREDCADAEEGIHTLVKVPLNQNQYDALVSLTFNIGRGNLMMSTLLRMLNAGDYENAAHQFARWNKQSGKILNGLVARRAVEQELFERPVA